MLSSPYHLNSFFFFPPTLCIEHGSKAETAKIPRQEIVTVFNFYVTILKGLRGQAVPLPYLQNWN